MQEKKTKRKVSTKEREEKRKEWREESSVSTLHTLRDSPTMAKMRV